MKLTVAVISRSAKLDADFINSLSFGDELLIISGEPKPTSTKSSNKIRIVYHPLGNNFSKQRNFALTQAKGEWVFFVDSDEIVSANLANEIKNVINKELFNGYYVDRIDLCRSRPFLYGETGNTKIIRLGKKKAGKFIRPVHETWSIKGNVGELIFPLYHNKDHFVSEFMERISLYGPTDAVQLGKEGKPYSTFRLLFYPKAKFFVNYFFKLGFLDGIQGLFLAYLMMVQSLSVRVFQWTSQKQSTV